MSATSRGPACTRLQVPLEGDRAMCVGEFHDDIKTPRAPGRCVRATTGVMRVKSRRDVRRQTRVIAIGLAFALRTSTKRLGGISVDGARQSPAGQVPENRVNSSSGESTMAGVAMVRRSTCSRFCSGRGLPTVARSGPDAHLRGFAATVGNLRLDHENLVAQISPSWNPVISWLRQMQRLKFAG